MHPLVHATWCHGWQPYLHTSDAHSPPSFPGQSVCSHRRHRGLPPPFLASFLHAPPSSASLPHAPPSSGSFPHALRAQASIFETGRGVWGLPCALSLPATSAMVQSDFLHAISERVPMVVPRVLWPLLPDDVAPLVARAQGVADWDAEKERVLAAAPPPPL
eukprot:158016-Chlamydomonas_euryale.AAC.1